MHQKKKIVLLRGENKKKSGSLICDFTGKTRNLILLILLRKSNSCLPCDEQQLQPLQDGSTFIPMRQAVTHALPPDGSHVVTVLAPSVTQKKNNRSQTSTTSSKNFEVSF